MQTIWNYEPDENVEHVEEHGLTVEDVEFVLENYDMALQLRDKFYGCICGATSDLQWSAGRRLDV